MKDFSRALRGFIKMIRRQWWTYLQLCWIRLFWIIGSVHDDGYRCGTITFERGESYYSHDISEGEYLYDLDGATLRIYYDKVKPNYIAKKAVGGAVNRLKRDRKNRREWKNAMKGANLR